MTINFNAKDDPETVPLEVILGESGSAEADSQMETCSNMLLGSPPSEEPEHVKVFGFFFCLKRRVRFRRGQGRGVPHGQNFGQRQTRKQGRYTLKQGVPAFLICNPASAGRWKICFGAVPSFGPVWFAFLDLAEIQNAQYSSPGGDPAVRFKYLVFTSVPVIRRLLQFR